MNIGIIGIILLCLGGVTFWGMLFSDFKFFYKLPPATIYLAVAAVIGGLIIFVIGLAYTQNSPKVYAKCSICGGNMVCAICGNEDALYCENASYGAGNDHYCQKHWADVVEWHEKK